MRWMRKSVPLVYAFCALVIVGQATRVAARYSHDCVVLQGGSSPAASNGQQAHAVPPCHQTANSVAQSGHAQSGHTQSEQKHNHDTCPVCQSFELSVAWHFEVAAPVVPAALLLKQEVVAHRQLVLQQLSLESSKARAPPA